MILPAKEMASTAFAGKNARGDLARDQPASQPAWDTKDLEQGSFLV